MTTKSNLDIQSMAAHEAEQSELNDYENFHRSDSDISDEYVRLMEEGYYSFAHCYELPFTEESETIHYIINYEIHQQLNKLITSSTKEFNQLQINYLIYNFLQPYILRDD